MSTFFFEINRRTKQTMGVRLFIFLVLLVKYEVKSSPVGVRTLENNTLYNAIVSKYPEIKFVSSFDQQDVFNKCTHWTETTDKKDIDGGCTLYFESVNHFCSMMKNLNLSLTNSSVKLIPEYSPQALQNVEDVCKKLNVTLNNEWACARICVDSDGILMPQCTLANYYTNYDFSPFTVHSPPQSENQSKNNSAPSRNNPAPRDGPDPNAGSNLEQKTANISRTGGDTGNNPQTAIQEEQPPSAAKLDKPPLAAKEVPPPPAAKEVPPPPVASVDHPPPADVPEQVGPGTGLENPAVPVLQNGSVTSRNATVAQQQNVSVVQQSSTSQLNKTNPKEVVGKSDDPPTSLANDRPKHDEAVVDKSKPAENDVIDTKGLPIDVDMSKPAEEVVDGSKGKSSFDTISPPLNVGDTPEKNEETQAVDETPLEGDVDNEDAYDDGPQPPDVLKKETETVKEKIEKPERLEEDVAINSTEIDGESYFFSYFMVICVLFVLGYVFYHNRTKVMALVIEGKKGRRQYRGRRPNSANYHKLDSNLEEAITSSCTKNSSNVIY